MQNKNLITLLLFVSAAFVLSACQTPGGQVTIGWPADSGHEVVAPPPGPGPGGPPAHAPAHGYRKKFGYRYYPDNHVYFDSARGVYFYLDADKWQMSVSLPSTLSVSLGDFVEIEMDSDKPYVEFDDHRKKYPGKKKGKRKGKGAWWK